MLLVPDRLEGQGAPPQGAEAAVPLHRLPGERAIHDRLFTFYDWCATYDYIPELLTLAKTVSRWETEIICAILTGASNAASESMNRIAKLEARLAYAFRNPINQRRRVRIACTRGVRRRQLLNDTLDAHDLTGASVSHCADGAGAGR